jgi:hypothetical protein
MDGGGAMNGIDGAAMDRWITGGDYHTATQEFVCLECGHEYECEVEAEYGGIVSENWACPQCESGEVETR